MADKSTVSRGGMWNAPKSTYSKETHQLLKTMMEESKLNNFQQRQLKSSMSDGSSLPTHVHPTSSAKRAPPPVAKPPSKIVDPRTHAPSMRNKEFIEASGAYDREKFRPMPQTKFGGFYEKDKDRLCNIMAYGQDIPPPNIERVIQKIVDKEVPERDRFKELQDEVEERRKFLEEMEKLGQGQKYRIIIGTEISQKIREMEVIDKKRCEELEHLKGDKK